MAVQHTCRPVPEISWVVFCLLILCIVIAILLFMTLVANFPFYVCFQIHVFAKDLDFCKFFPMKRHMKNLPILT